MTEEKQGGGNGFELGFGSAHVIGRGPMALAFLTILGLLAAIGVLTYSNHTGFAAIERSHELLSNDIRCLIWVLADEHSRKRMSPPLCIRAADVVP